MSGSKLFLDTNILLYFLAGNIELVELISENEAVVSFVSELEALSYPDLSSADEEKINGLIRNCQLINLNQEIKALTIALKRKYKLKLPDAIIAGTAYHLNLPLLTADKQFRQVSELEMILYEL